MEPRQSKNAMGQTHLAKLRYHAERMTYAAASTGDPITHQIQDDPRSGFMFETAVSQLTCAINPSAGCHRVVSAFGRSYQMSRLLQQKCDLLASRKECGKLRT